MIGMSTIQIAFYKGPATDWLHKLTHWGICLVTLSKYSHCELVIHGTCVSSSARDGGVRAKQIELTSGKWTVLEIADPTGDFERQAWDWFATHAGQRYDWVGIARFLLPFLPHRRDQWFCSEACAAALGLVNPSDWTPAKLAKKFTPP